MTPHRTTDADASPLHFLFSGSEMGVLTGKYNWSTTSLGTPENWPDSLTHTLGILLRSPFPMLLFWGEELVCFYNDAFRPSLGKEGKHPQILGKPAKEAWPEAWDTIAPLMKEVMEKGGSFIYHDRLLPIFRNGRLENVYWTFSYSPVMDRAGKVGGVLTICTETTSRVNKLQNVVENAKAPVMIFKGEDLIVEEANQATLDLWQVGKEVLGKPFLEIKPEFANQGYVELLLNVYRTGQPYQGIEMPAFFHRPNGKVDTFYYNFEYSAYREANGEITGVMILATDVTGQVLNKQKLEVAEDEMRVAIKAADLGYWNIDPQSNTLKCNETTRELFGLPQDENVDISLALNNIHEEDRDRVMDTIQAAFRYEHEGRCDIEYRVLNQAHGVCHIRAIGQAYLNPKGEVYRFSGTVQNITKEKQAQADLTYRKALLEAQSNAVPDGILIVDTKGKILSFNKRFAQIWGIPQAIIDAKDDAASLGHAMTLVTDPQAFIERVNYLYEHTQESAREEITLKDGRVLERHGNAVTGEDGTNFGWAWHFRDITEERKAAQALKESNERFELVSKATQDPIWDWNLETNAIWWNDGFKTLFGYSDEDIEPGIESWYNRVHPEDKERVIGGIHTVIDSGGKTWADEYRFLRKDGSYAVVLDRGYVLHDEANKPCRMLGSMQDFTERRAFENMLEENESRFRGTFENAAVGISLVDLNGGWLMVNERLCNIVGYSREELLASNFQQVTHPEDLDNDLELIQKTLDGTINSYTLEKRYIHKQGIPVWVNLTVSLVRNEKNEPQYFIGIIKDISDRKKAIAALEESEEKYRSLFETMDQGFCIIEVIFDAQDVGVDYRFLEYNERLSEQSGLKDAIGKTMRELVPGIEGHWAQTYGKVARTGVPIRFMEESEAMGRWFEVYAYKTGDKNSNKVAILFTDVTERKKAEAAIRESEEKFRQLADFLPQIVWTSRPDGYLDYYNRRWYQYTGMQEGFGDGSWTPILHPDDVQHCMDTWYHSIQTGDPYQIEYRFKEAATGNYRWHLGKALPIRDKDQNIIKWFGTCTDIHDQKTIEEQLETLVAERTRELQHSNEDLQQFAHVASHDLKEPVRKIRTFTGRMKEELAGTLTEKGHLYLTKIEKSAERMYDMIDGVLLYSSLEAMRQTAEEVDLNDIIQNIQSDLEVVIEQKEAVITSADIPMVEGAPILLYQLFYNLINNSLKFAKANERPRISISSEVLSSGAAGALNLATGKTFVRISLKDNGIGFAQSEAERIFKTFSRLNSKDKYEGTGLGLALCKKIVERHGGKIWAEGKLGEGSVFTILLPVFNDDNM